MDSLRFLLHELGSYYNTFGVDENPPSIDQDFFPMLHRYFKNCEIPVEFVFAVECWVTSVMVLQGHSTMSRIFYLTKGIVSNLNARVDECFDLAKNLGPPFEDTFSKLKGRHNVESIYKEGRVLQRNPWLCGVVVLNSIFEYNILGCELWHATTQFKSFLHLYSVILREYHIAPNSILDSLIQMFRDKIFESDDQQLSRGCHYNRWHTSVSVKPKHVEDWRRWKKKDDVARMFRFQKGFHLQLVSKLFVFFEKNVCVDSQAFGVRPSDVHGFLSMVEAIAVSELHTTQNLSLDFIKLARCFWKAFVILKEKLGLEKQYQVYLNSYEKSSGMSFEYFQKVALDHVVGGGIIMGIDLGVADPELKEAFESVLDEFFSDPTKFYLLPEYAYLISQEFGSCTLPDPFCITSSNAEYYAFEDLMDYLEDTNDDFPMVKEKIQSLVRKSPMVTRLVYSGSVNFPTLVHHAAGNPVICGDPSLLDWLLLMGGDFFLQPKYSPVKKNPLHLAAERGSLSNIFVICFNSRHALNAQDELLNTPLHCASSPEVSFVLRMQGGNPLAVNAEGKLPSDMSKNSQTKMMLDFLSVLQRESIEKNERHQDRTSQMLMEVSAKALRKTNGTKIVHPKC
eukprot:TRINITY_DN5394_c0_g1_i2.p1 TRINITY_DN5394_c0_g1~~TRINITY_DN5394_c0_g1_i2.p1  ORF type:complete len:700 (-),score=157.51 TRINITY_DN5394_c0_g1_i2:16-1884(-)